MTQLTPAVQCDGCLRKISDEKAWTFRFTRRDPLPTLLPYLAARKGAMVAKYTRCSKTGVVAKLKTFHFANCAKNVMPELAAKMTAWKCDRVRAWAHCSINSDQLTNKGEG